MKKLLLFISLITTTLTAFAQNGKLLFGPVPYRSPEQTIGETYVILPLSKRYNPNGYDFIKQTGKDEKLTDDAAGKKIVLTKIDNETKKGYFKDSVGVEYENPCIDGLIFFEITPLADLEAARKLFLNKTLWLNAPKLFTGDALNNKYGKSIENVRFEPVIITDILLNGYYYNPLIFVAKTAKNETGFLTLNISGTNSKFEQEYFFENMFFQKDPKKEYNFTPAVWQLVKKGWIDPGMPLDAFILSQGKPTHVNTSKTGNTSRVQLVYGETSPTYYYFVNGKYTSKN